MKLVRLVPIIFSLLTLVSGRGVLGLDLASQVHSLRLSNGMRWLVVYRPQLPIFSGIVVARVGGADEALNKTGLAHMFEHMAFKGSKDIGTIDFVKESPFLEKIEKLGEEMSKEQQKEKPDLKKVESLRQEIQKLTGQEYQYMARNEVWGVLTRKGAENLNAFTTKDVTAYHASMPKSQFPLWAYITSEMVFHPVMREFYQERDVVMEERRLRYDNNPNGFLWEALVKEAFPKGPYSWAAIGDWKDLVGLTMNDAYAFHREHYIPENIVGVLVGAITPSEAKKELERFFGKIPSKKPPKEPANFSFALQGEKRKIVSYPALPNLVMAFYKPKAPSREDYVFDILDSLLCEGRTGRLYQRLVKQEKIASNVYCSASFPGSRFDNLFVILASPIKGHSLEKLEGVITDELEKIKQEIKTDELEKVRKWVVHNFLWGLNDNLQLAEQLAIAEAVLKDWHYVPNYPKVIQSIEAEEIQQIAQKYFVKENRVVLYRVRGKKS